MTDLPAPADRMKVLEVIVVHLGRLQGLAKGINESFIAFAIASAQREAASRCKELSDPEESGDEDRKTA